MGGIENTGESFGEVKSNYTVLVQMLSDMNGKRCFILSAEANVVSFESLKASMA